MITPQLLMFLMFPWFIGHLICLFMDGTYIGIWEQNIINIIGAFDSPEQNGLWAIMTNGSEVFTDSLARILLWKYSFFEGDYSIFRWVLLFVLTIPLIIGFILSMKSLAEGIFR